MTKGAESKPPSSTPVAVGSEPVPAHVISLIRHFTDLRDGVHGDAVSRHDEEEGGFSRTRSGCCPPSHIKRSVR